MGSSQESMRYMLQQLQCRPHTVTWSQSQQVIVHRGANNKLGFHFKTFKCGQEETVTVVVLVKPDCVVRSGSLRLCDRIISVGGKLVTGLDEASVKDVFSKLQSSVVELEVSTMIGTQVKRFHSINSGASDNSQTKLVDSGDRRQVKRFAKSNSTETPPVSSPSSEHHQLIGEESSTVQPHRLREDCDPRQACYHSSHTQSLPARMENDIILTDDIVIRVPDGPNSLPPVLTPDPNAPSSSACQQCSGYFATTMSTRIGGASAVSGELHAGTADYKTLGVEVCRAPGCTVKKMCLWHKFVLTFPQYVIWDAFTKTVLLEKNNSASFGFKYKVKKYDGPPEEVFAIVTEVVSGGVAWTSLLPGDWIRSINGSAVNTPKEAFCPDFRNLISLRLVIQRPEGLSPKGVARLRQQARSMRINLRIPPQISDPLPLTPIRSISEPAVEEYPGLELPPGELGEQIPLMVLDKSSYQSSSCEVDRCVLPQTKVVICGAHGSAANFARGLLGDCAEVTVDSDANVQSFLLSIHQSANLRTLVRPHFESLVALLSNSESKQSSGLGVDCVNIELYVINDEEFFHHCCSWLLPTTALILLTFPIQKLLNQPEPEAHRLAAMMHTVQACCDSTDTKNYQRPEVLMYGVPSALEKNISAEEVQAIFYVTKSGSWLLEHHAHAMPSVAVPTCSVSMATVQQQVFWTCQNHASQVLVQQPAIEVMDTLLGTVGMSVSGQELSSIVSRITGDANMTTLRAVIQDLLTSGNLIQCGGSQMGSGTLDQDYLFPVRVFQAIASFLIKPKLDAYSLENRQKWFKLMTTGQASRSELSAILKSESNCLSLKILEHLGIVFRFQSSVGGSQGDSGFGGELVHFVIPYFLMEVTDDKGKWESESQKFVLTFEGYVSSREYFDLIGKINSLPATEELVLQGQCSCVVRRSGLRLRLDWRKTSDCNTVLVSVARLNHQLSEVEMVQLLKQLFSCVIPQTTFRLHPLDPSADSIKLSSHPSSPAAQTSPVPPVSYSPDETETLLKPVAASVEQLDTPHTIQNSRHNLPLTALPWSVLKQVALKLTVNMASGNDWKSVAALAGMSMTEISAYESITSFEVPAMLFLREWILTGTVQQFLDILHMVERPDVQDLILKHLEERASLP